MDPRRTDPSGHTVFCLHSHLPYVHHPDYEDFLEEDWLFEGMAETYLPLLFVMHDLLRDGVPFRLAFSMTPPLVEMLRTPILQRKFVVYLTKRLELARRELGKWERTSTKAKAAEHYVRRYAQMLDLFESIDRDIPRAFGRLQELGSVEILASAATHGYLPLFRSDASIRAQLRVGVDNYKRTFGRAPRGMWLPECAFRPGLDQFLREVGIEWVCLESHAVLGALPTPFPGTFRPVRLPSGLLAFGRDKECSEQVWSSVAGYPGDPTYRELYRDLGFDGDYAEVRPFLKPDGVRRNLGIKYHRITGKVDLHQKDLWDPHAAKERAQVHAGNFLFNRSEQLKHQRHRIGERPVILAPFDTELFGHWWYEGPWFLEQIFREADRVGKDLPFDFATPSEIVGKGGSFPDTFVHASSWGAGGFYRVWLNEKNAWIWPHLHAMETAMEEVAQKSTAPNADEKRLLNQMGRELLLAQSSDWPFILTMDTSAYYAEQRFRTHVHRFWALNDALHGKPLPPDEQRRIEKNDAIFRELDFAVWR